MTTAVKPHANGKRLNGKRAAFVQAYLIDPNATRAAQAAGYSPKTAYSQGQRLLKNVEVSKLVKSGQQKQADRNQISEDKVVAGLLAEAKRTGEGSSHGARVAAWTALGKHIGMFSDRHEVSGAVVIRVVRDDPALVIE